MSWDFFQKALCVVICHDLVIKPGIGLLVGLVKVWLDARRKRAFLARIEKERQQFGG